MAEQRIICVSNRLPVTAQTNGTSIVFHPSSGGLVTAMGPVLRKSRGAWIGWPGAITGSDAEASEALATFSADSECSLYPVFLDQESIAGFYQGFSNQIIWPLFHDLQCRCNFEPAFWSTYQEVQLKFRDEIVRRIEPTDLVWVHDYHLMGTGRALRDVNVSNRMCFFLHTPFPGPDIFLKLPWRSEVIDSMLSYDLIGFQTNRDLKNFCACVDAITPSRCVRRDKFFVAVNKGRETVLGNFPISIDFSEFEDIATQPQVEEKAQKIREDMKVDYLILSIDRLDYTKGIPYRIKAFRRLLEKNPDLKHRIALLQVVVPSREEVPEYQQLRAEIEQLVSQVNGVHSEPGWVPVHHLFRSLTREDVIAMYRASDVALVTPLKDGMNLVAKEYCASRIKNGGALVLSEFAGAADELTGHALLVNPYDIDGVADALVQALATAQDDARGKMKEMRSIVRQADVFTWASAFLKAAGHSGLSSDPAPHQMTIWERLSRITNVFDM